MLSTVSLLALLASSVIALPAPEPVQYDDVCEQSVPYEGGSLPPPISSSSTTSHRPTSTSSTPSPAFVTPFPVNNGSSPGVGSLGPTGGSNGGPSVTTTSASPVVTGGGSSNSSGGSSAGNPFAGKQLYANPFYASEVSAAAASMTANAAQASSVAKVGTFAWLDSSSKVPNVGTYLGNIQKSGSASKTIAGFVVYDLPNRDCAAAASNGEYSVADDGLTKYKAYIDSIKKQLGSYPDVSVALVIEPDSLGNLVTNANMPNCSAAADAYKDGVAYAIKTLDAPNVAQYLDAGHAGWLGWPANIGPAAELFGSVYKAAGSPKSVRGLATNTANYNAFSTTSCPSYTQGSKVCDEKTYINNMAPLLQQAGFPAHFIIDTSRNGKQPTGQQAWGDWCNIKGAGFGARYTTATGDPLADAFAWIKPGGEGDGTSNATAPRYDSKCSSAASLTPAPQAGAWFQAYFEQLVTNANPPL